MNNFHVYRDGHYDRKENIKIKLQEKIDLIKADFAGKLETVDYYFTHHQMPVK